MSSILNNKHQKHVCQIRIILLKEEKGSRVKESGRLDFVVMLLGARWCKISFMNFKEIPIFCIQKAKFILSVYS